MQSLTQIELPKLGKMQSLTQIELPKLGKVQSLTQIELSAWKMPQIERL